ncbi:DUF3482 domain-containing protein [Alkalisalibacterium limincola]|uniref:DUF3482 domain-containing protein n=1 Tax=Alkalisalibacterium limincola TaxID=2699169 RepID=A0A5C8KJS2_9GAMM|nr:DUF3482 domain-containing protein [Alkalisalibacterium limincola]TXK60998.1 DUF3482 domain-containing protein [Alkalisalibacterium limincola]
MADPPASAPVTIAVVGHANTGKTSLVRTLTRDRGFGEVSPRPGTTRHVEGVQLMADGRALVELHDTPGLEDPGRLRDFIDARWGADRIDGPARIDRFLDSPEADGHWAQEAKVLRRLRTSDAGFFVIDARDPVLAKHRDELALLSACAVPLLPVLNFVRGGDTHEADWREALGRHGLHASVAFDAFAPERDAEARLYQALGTLLGKHRDAFDTLVDARKREFEQRRSAATHAIAELLVDLAAVRREVPSTPEAAMRKAVAKLGDDVRRHEARTVRDLLALYQFDEKDVDAPELPLLDGRWELDLFNPEALKQAGVSIAGGAAGGAAAGAAIDAMTGFLSLGAGAALGALIGGGARKRREILAMARKRRLLSVDDPILALVAQRNLALVKLLEARGHGAEGSAAMSGDAPSQKLPRVLNRARSNPEWSRLGASFQPQETRESSVEMLAYALQDGLEADAGRSH